MNQDPNYTSLRAVLDEAYAQAATGKGKERHAGGQPFEQQPMQVISDMLGSNDGMAYQAIKKIREGLAMPDPDRTVRELLGAIVYVAGIVVRVQRGEMQVAPDPRAIDPAEKRCKNCVFSEMVPAPRVCFSCKGYSHWRPIVVPLTAETMKCGEQGNAP